MTARSDALRADLVELNRELEARGLFARPAGRVLRDWLLGLALGLGGVALLASSASWPVRIAGLLASTMGFIAMATIGHTASHGGFAGPRANSALYYLTYPFILMVSARYWRHSHVHVHHAAPNVVGVDPDCDLRPYFWIHSEHARAGAWGRVQGLLFPLLLPLNGFHIQAQGWRRLIAELRDPRLRGPAVWADLGCMVAHIAVFIALPMAYFPTVLVLAVYAARVTLIGTALFAILAPGHYPAEAACLASTERHAGDFWSRQTATTINFRTGLVGRWLCSGLEYQIEHHLFPHVSHVHLPELSVRVRALCEKHGLPYRSFGWGEAIWKSYRVFFAPKRVVALADIGLEV